MCSDPAARTSRDGRPLAPALIAAREHEHAAEVARERRAGRTLRRVTSTCGACGHDVDAIARSRTRPPDHPIGTRPTGVITSMAERALRETFTPVFDAMISSAAQNVAMRTRATVGTHGTDHVGVDMGVDVVTGRADEAAAARVSGTFLDPATARRWRLAVDVGASTSREGRQALRELRAYLRRCEEES